MKIVKILGGLGNQMFQYALYIALKQRLPEERVMVDYSYFNTYHVHNGLELERVFGVELPQASFGELLKVTWPVRSFRLSRAIRKLLPKRRTECVEHGGYAFNTEVFSVGDKYYDGYWQSVKYFEAYKDVVLRTFKFSMPINEKSERLLQLLEHEDNSVSIHVRRGDYLKAKKYAGLCGEDYYQRAIACIKSNIAAPSFYIFSDDMEWCRVHIATMLGNSEVTYVDWNNGNDSPLDMLLMSRCNHNIIANSSFSWWAAYLNGNEKKIVCAPKKWTNAKICSIRQLPEWKLF